MAAIPRSTSPTHDHDSLPTNDKALPIVKAVPSFHAMGLSDNLLCERSIVPFIKGGDAPRLGPVISSLSSRPSSASTSAAATARR